MSLSDEQWVAHPEPGWTKIALPHRALGESFLLGDERDHRLALQYFREDADRALRAKVIFGTGAQGPPGHAHGGSIAALLDEGMGGAVWLVGHAAVAVELTTRFKRMVPLGSRCVMRASVQATEGRKVRASGLLADESGNPYADADGLFVEIDLGRFEATSDEAARLIADAREKLLRD